MRLLEFSVITTGGRRKDDIDRFPLIDEKSDMNLCKGTTFSQNRNVPTSTSMPPTVLGRIDRYQQKQANWDVGRPVEKVTEEALTDKIDTIPLQDENTDNDPPELSIPRNNRMNAQCNANNEIEEEQEWTKTRKKQQRKKMTIICLVLLLIIVVATVVGLMLGEEGISGNDTMLEGKGNNSDDFSINMKRYGIVMEVLEPHLERYEGSLSQHQLDAIDWLANIDTYSFSNNTTLPSGSTISSTDVLVIDENELIERYVLAVLYFSTSLKSSFSYLSEDLSFCYWNDGGLNSIGVFCDSSNTEDITSNSTMQNEKGSKTTVVKIVLDDRNLFGPIPLEIGLLSNLQHLSLDRNGLTGTIPGEIGNLQNLTSLNLDNNQLTGTIPTEIGKLSSLAQLSLYNNQLTGTIPTEVGTLSSLAFLFLHKNDLTGTIPTEIGKLSSLSSLYLDNDQLTGTIPTEIGKLSSLELLDLANNEFTGVPPSEIAALPNLQYISFRSNFFSGVLDPSYCNLSDSVQMDLVASGLTRC